MRQYLKFYINKRNGKLYAIWFNKRQGKYSGQYGENWSPLEDTDPTYAVRTVRLCRTCDRYAINKVAYYDNPESCIIRIDKRILTHKLPMPENLTDYNYDQLVRCPTKYVEEFYKFCKEHLCFDDDQIEVIAQGIRNAVTRKIKEEAKWLEAKRQLTDDEAF